MSKQQEEQSEEQEGQKETFSGVHFLKKLTSRLFLAWIIVTTITCIVLMSILFSSIEPEKYAIWIKNLLWIWGGVTALFICGNVLIDAIGKAVEKANLSINTSINASANTSISGSATGSANAASGGPKQ